MITEATVRAIERSREAGRSLWRVSSTCFGQIQSDQMLVPLGHFLDPDTAARFPPVLAGDQVSLTS